jgi:hypothetical protein
MTALIYALPNVPMLGKGLIMFAKILNGVQQGFYPLGNCTKLELEPKDDIAELYESINSAASLIATALKKRQIKIAITGTDFKDDVMDLVLMGNGKTTVSTTAVTFTAEILVPATVLTHKGRYFQTLHRNVDGTGTVPVVTNNSVPLVAGTDYVLQDPVQGIIYFPSTTGAVDGMATTITYHTLVGSQTEVAGGVSPTIKGAIKFSPDPTDGQKIALDVWNINMSPTGQIGLISDDYGNWQLDGLILGDYVNHPTQPFYRATFLA